MTGACDTALGQSSSMEQQAGGSGTWRPPSLVSNPKDDRIPSRVFTAGERVTIIDVTDPSFQPMRTTFAALDVSSEQPSSSADLSLPRSCSEERYQRGGPVSKTRLEPVKARATSHASALPSTYAASDGPAITQGDDLRSIPGYRSLQERGKSEELPAGSRPSSTNSLPRKRKMMAMRAPPPRSMADPKCSDEKSDLVQRGVAVSLGSSSAQSASNLDSSCPRTTRPGSEAASQASQHASRASSVLSASSPFGVRGRESVGPGSPSLNGSSAKVVKRPKPSKKSKPFPRIPTASLGDGEKEGASRRRSNRIATSSSGNDRSWRLARRNPGSGRGSAWDGLTFCFDEDQEIDFGLWGIVRFPSPPYTPPWLVANEEGNEGASNLSSLTGSRRVTPFEMDGHRGKGKVQGKKNLKGGKAYHKARGPLTGSGFSDDDEVGLAYPSVARDMIEFEKAYKKKIYDYLDLLSYQLRADLGEAPHVDIQELRKRQLIHGTLDDIDSEALSGAAQSAARVKDEIEEASLDGLTGGKGERGQSPGKSTTDGSLAIERLCSENRSLASKQMRQEPGADFRHQEVICRADGATWRHPSDLSHSSLSMGARREESSGNADLLSKQQEYGGRFHGYASSSHRRSRSPTSRNFHPSFQNTEPVSEFDRRLPGRGSDLYGSNLNESRFGQIFGQGYSEIASREAEGDPGHYGTHGFRDWSRLKQDAIGSRFEMQNDGFETRPVGFQGSSRHTITPRDPFDQGYGSQSSGAGNFALGEGRYPSKYDEASDALGLVDYHAPGYGQGRAFPGDARSRFLPDPARGDVITDPTYDLSERSSGRRLDYDPRFQSDRLPLVASDVGGEHLDPSRRVPAHDIQGPIANANFRQPSYPVPETGKEPFGRYRATLEEEEDENQNLDQIRRTKRDVMSVSALCTPSSPPRPKKIWRTGNPPDHDKRMNDDVSSEMPAEGGAESAWKKVGLVDEEVLESEREVIRSNPCSSRPSISRSTSSSGLQGGEEKEQAALEREIDGPVQVCFSQETCSALYALVPAFQEFDQKLEEESLKEVAKFKKVLDSQIESLERSKRAERRFVEVDYRDKVGQLWRRESESIRRKIWQAGLERKLLDRVLSRLDGPAGLLRRLHEDLNCLVEGSESGDELASLSSRSSTCSSNLSSSASRSPSSSPSPSASSSSSVKSGERATTIRELSVASDDGMTRHGETNSVSFLFDLHRLRRVPYQRVGMSFPEGKSGRGIKLMASEARIRKDFEMMGIKTLPFDRVLPGEDERVQHPAFLPLATTTTTLSTRREEDSKAAAEALLQVSGGFLQVGTSVGVEKGKSRQEDQSTSRSWECLLMASTMLAGGEVEEVEVEGDFDVGSRGFETLTKGLGRSTRSSAGDQVFDAEENSDSDSVRLGQGSNGSNGEIQGGVREDGLARGSFEGMRSDEFDGSSTSGVSSVGNDPGRTQDRSSESIMTPPLPKVKKEPRDGAAALVSEEDRYTASAEDAVGEESGKNSLRRSPRIRKSRELYSPKDRRVVSSVSNQSTNVAVERGNGTGNGNGFEMDDARVAKRSLSRRDTNGRSSENGSPRGREGKRKRGDGRDPHGTGPGMEEQGGQEEEDAEEDAEEEEIGFDLPSTGEEGDRRKRRRKDPGSNEGGSRPAESRPSSSSSSSSSSPTTSFRRSESNPPSNSRHERKEEKKRKRSEPPTAPPERMEIERGKPPPPVRIDELKNRPVPPAASGGGGIRWWKKGNPTNTTTTTSTENRRKG